MLIVGVVEDVQDVGIRLSYLASGAGVMRGP